MFCHAVCRGRVAVVALCVVTLSCSAQEPPSVPQPTASSCIRVEPNWLNFGESDAPRVERQVKISNGCEAPLYLNKVRLDDTTHFSLGPQVPTVVWPRSSEVLTVLFEPKAAGAHSTALRLRSDAAGHRFSKLRVGGVYSAPSLRIDPESMDYSTRPIGCDDTVPLRIWNDGERDLSVDSIELVGVDSKELRVDLNRASNGELPFVLSSDRNSEAVQFVTIYLTYHPLDSVHDRAEIVLTSNDPLHPSVRVAVRGRGADVEPVVDSFELSRDARTDILFVLDRSCSLDHTNVVLARNIGALTAELRSWDADYHIGVVVGDSGCVVGSNEYIDSSFSASEATEAFIEMNDAHMAYAPYGSLTGEGFLLASRALSKANTKAGGCNGRFIRSGALLNIVHIADQPSRTGSDWPIWVDHFRDLTSPPAYTRIHAVAGEYPSGCIGAMFGAGYYNAVEATGGVYRSICDLDWEGHLRRLAAASFGMGDVYQLSKPAIAPTVVVRVDGVQWGSGWTYDGERNVVVFDLDVLPGPGALIEFEYSPRQGCGG